MRGLDAPHARHWLSRGFEELAARGADACFDVVIVGSGYGGSIAAHHLAPLYVDGRPLRIAMLERGNEYVKGAFPAEFGDLPPHVRITPPGAVKCTGRPDALFDLRLGSDVSTLLGNGLGGGSLINAGVMVQPEPGVFDNGWPDAISADSLRLYYEESESILGAAPLTSLPQKYTALARLAPDRTRPASVTIATETTDVTAACNYCGNCATGCNFGAKLSLDVSLLAEARRNNRYFECFTGASVVRLEKDERQGWQLHVVYSDQDLARRFPGPFAVTARYVILAAGSLGTTELLQKSTSPSLSFSPRLGRQFSTNGDMLAVGFEQVERVGAIAQGPGPGNPGGQGPGPTITGVADLRGANGILLEELTVPWPIRELFAEVFATVGLLHGLNKGDGRHESGWPEPDPFAVNVQGLDATAVYALMGDDGAEGVLQLPDGDEVGEGTLEVEWPQLRHHPLFRRQLDLLGELLRNSGSGGRLLPNPLWKPVPESMNYLSGGNAGPLFTVHPLGGCAMADSGADGVVDHIGRVYSGPGTDLHEGLVVLDGSIIPRALGANPALTISALALRAVRDLALIWGCESKRGTSAPLPPRPVYRVADGQSGVDARVPHYGGQTGFRLHERMVGEVLLMSPRGPVQRVVELTLASEGFGVDNLVGPGEKRLKFGRGSRLRVFEPTAYRHLQTSDPTASIEQMLDDLALVAADLSGELRLFQREASWAWPRAARAGLAWLLNRGLRDIWQGLASGQPTWGMARDVLAVATRAGEIRTLEYLLAIDVVHKDDAAMPALSLAGQQITGTKRLNYHRASNVLHQLMTLALTGFPALMSRPAPVLTLEPGYLARIGVPLLEVVDQKDTPTTLLDLLKIGGYMARLMVSTHGWQFRLPDGPATAPLSRLPTRLPGVDAFEQYPLRDENNQILPTLLTRYRRRHGDPVVFFHGYSASGTTFAHEALEPSIAAYLWHAGFDVWVVDFRTSPGLPTAVSPWRFEDVAEQDIPLSIAHIARQTSKPVNVVAHCMGAAMFSMAVLGDGTVEAGENWRNQVRRVVLTQVGPAVVFTPPNIFRAYTLAFLRYFLNLTRFDFRIDNRTRLSDQLLDRVLNLLPYPAEEFRTENPVTPWRRTPFVAIRHRMDLLYGRDFSLNNVTPAFLDNIDAMFGPMNLRTVAQAVHLTRWKNVTDHLGVNRYVQRARLERFWQFETLSLHGAQNGLSSPATLARNLQIFNDAGVHYETRLLPGFGHQDIWVSPRSETEVFPLIREFLQRPLAQRDPQNGRGPLVAAPPFLGPIMLSCPDGSRTVRVKLGKSPNLSEPEALAIVPVRLVGGRIKTDGFTLADSNWESRVVVVPGVKSNDAGVLELDIRFADRDTRLLVLLLYNEHPAMLDRAFGDPPVELVASGRRYGAGESGRRIADALQAALDSDVAQLKTGLLQHDPRPGIHISFASCQYPPGLIDRIQAFSSWRQLLQRIEAEGAPGLLLLLGDQVYVDATAGLFDPGESGVKYQRPYQALLSANVVQQVLGRVPVAMMLDDHEIDNNWQPGDSPDSLEWGEAAFRAFQWSSFGSRRADKFWGAVDNAPLPVFMLNTRTDRTPRDHADPLNASLVSDHQLNVFKSWLLAQDPRLPKLVTTAALLLPRRLLNHDGDSARLREDGFDGYQKTFIDLLAFIATEQIGRVVFLSGDEHLPLVAKATLRDGGRTLARVCSIHTSPLYAPFPFGNAIPEDFVMEEEIDLGGGLTCTVGARAFSDKAGFTSLEFIETDSGWWVRGLFEGGHQRFEIELD
ncbi:MAG: alkaline phosphatase D family protein [Pseudomonadota bacterium]